MSTQTKMGLGAALATVGTLGIVLSFLLGWTEAVRPWGYIVGFIVGVITGLGATLSIAGLLERRRSPSDPQEK